MVWTSTFFVYSSTQLTLGRRNDDEWKGKEDFFYFNRIVGFNYINWYYFSYIRMLYFCILQVVAPLYFSFTLFPKREVYHMIMSD